MATFPSIRALDLHGNTTRAEYPPKGIVDRNVFDIQQGVAICIATRGGESTGVLHADLWGTQSVKYAWFDNTRLKILSSRGSRRIRRTTS